MTEAPGDDQMLLRMLDRQRMDALVKLELYHNYGEIDVATRDRLVQRVNEMFGGLVEQLTGPTP